MTDNRRDDSVSYPPYIVGFEYVRKDQAAIIGKATGHVNFDGVESERNDREFFDWLKKVGAIRKDSVYEDTDTWLDHD